MLQVSRFPDGSPEIFYSVQGEGVNTGRPAVFIRLAQCNLCCTWCDTKYTWDWEHYSADEQTQKMSIGEIEDGVFHFNSHFVVVTGGEPLLQQKQLLALLKKLKNTDIYIEIETNGTKKPVPGIVDLVDHWSVSPKMSNSGNPVEEREVAEVYEWFAGQPNIHFKYVLQNSKDLKELDMLVVKYDIDPGKIILMPEAHTPVSLLRKSRWVIEACKEHGYLFSTRLQVLLWGNKRGV